MSRADSLLAALQHVHEAAFTPDGWTPALPAIATSLRSQHACLFSREAGGTIDFITGFGFASEYLTRYAKLAREGHVPPDMVPISSGLAIRSSTVMPDREFAGSVVYNEFVRPIGAFYGFVATLLCEQERQVMIMVGRLLGKDDYDAEDVATMGVLVPHLMNALKVGHRLAAADLRAANAYAALDRLGVGVILVDAAARILFVNRLAEAVLAACDGLAIDKEGLRASDPHTTRTLRRLVFDCAEIALTNGGPGGSVDVPRAATRAPLHVLVAPARSETDQAEMAWLGTAQPAAILIITDPEQEQQVRKEDLRRRFRLTTAEAEVAVEIVKGDGRDAVAARLGVSMTTVCTHLSHIFEKTGARRQAELVHLLMDGERCPANTDDDAHEGDAAPQPGLHFGDH